jgi:glycosyltransferase involved in cell wall biosynthesis
MILVDGRLISNTRTGISNYSRKIVEFYVEEYGEDKVHVLLNEKVDLNCDCNKIYTNLKPFNLLHFILFYFFIKSLKPKVYHSLFYSGLLFKNNSIKTILTVHDLMYRVIGDFFSENYFINTLAIKYYNILVRRSIKNSDAIISVSKTTARDVKKIFGKDSSVIYEGVCIETVNTFSSSMLDKFSVKENKYFLYVGSNRPHKNVDFLVNTFKNFDGEEKLVLVGCNLNSTINGIVNAGYISNTDLACLYKFAKAVVLPSKYEGFGLPILESLSYKTPLIVSEIEVFREFESENINFFDLKNSNDLLRQLNNVLPFKKTDNTIEKFNWDKAKPEYLFIMDSLLDE